MAVGFMVDCFFYEAGHGDFVHSFFSTISYHLEKDGWGTKYPLLMNDLYHDKLKWSDVPAARNNLKEIEAELSKLPPENVVWDIEDLSKNPPWGNNISPKVTNLSNYFATNDGKTFFEVLYKAMDASEEDQYDMTIQIV
ncbi:immunity 70 family protein [Bacillus haynesii]|uniref:immunity 70 family protein n=1 Tax=Bacillus haynesii TaxID=1925021 RepID=UPI00227EDBBA|nr:immunity 70 family protein [Bacillus haynesii]MCY8609868.1 immunity 70 family protein [Bacillus haynesii]